jgi:PAS domain S-box-containing protein
MLIGFAPPYSLRVAWRRHDESTMKEARLSLMSATTESEVARTLLLNARRLVGAAGAVLEGAQGEIIASDIPSDEARASISSLRADHTPSGAASIGPMVTVPMSPGRLTITANPLMPFFGHDEVAELEGFAALADLALARIRLTDNQRRLAEIVESSNDAIVAQSLDGTIRAWNRGAERMYGYRSEEATGQPISLIIPPDIGNEAAELLGKVRRGERIEHYETRRRTKDGRTLHVSLNVSPIRDADGKITGASAIAHDVTELRRASEALRKSEERSRTIIKTANDAYVEIDAASVVREWNSAAAEIFGIARADAVGRELPELVIPARYRDAHREGMARYLATGEGPVVNTTTEITALRGQSEEFPIELTIWPVGVGSEVTFHAFVRDITERKTADAAIRSAQEEADRANRAKSEYLSRMSHELRTPLNAILGFAQLLDMDSLTPDQTDATKEILKAGNHLIDLINEVLDIARIEAGGLRLSLEPVDAVQAVEECLSLLTPLADTEGVTLELVAGRGHDRLHVTADRQRLKQVLLNLISNGIKYNRQDGGVTVVIEPVEPGRVRIAITDTGLGIPPDRMARLFAPFERLGAEGSSVEGTGLGLALSKPLVEAMAGTLSVASEPGRGTTFSVELARAVDVSDTEDEAPPASSISDAAAATSGVGTDVVPGSRTVLYIEDNLSNVKLVERLLARRPGIALLSAMQGSMGVTLARDHRPDLILLDLNLPDLPGEKVLARLLSDPRTADIPVVVISADATPGQVTRLLDAGARAYMTKPFDVSRFFKIVDDFCGAKGPSAG